MRCSASDGSVVGWGGGSERAAASPALPHAPPHPCSSGGGGGGSSGRSTNASGRWKFIQRISFTRIINADAREIECKVLRKKYTLFD